MEAPEELQVKHVHVGFITQLWWLLLQEAGVKSVNLFRAASSKTQIVCLYSWFTCHSRAELYY